MTKYGNYDRTRMSMEGFIEGSTHLTMIQGRRKDENEKLELFKRTLCPAGELLVSASITK